MTAGPCGAWRRPEAGRRRGSRPPGRMSVVCLAVLPLAFLSPDLRAQASPALDAVERAADAGELAAARRLLTDWFGSEEAADRSANAGRARFLRARLTEDLDSARVDYLWVAVRGDDRYGASARLRLAQLYLAEGRLDRAADDLDRLRADFPGSPEVLSSWLWTGNVRFAAGDATGACAAWERAASGATGEGSGEDRALAVSALEMCGRPPLEALPATFSVQLGAFRSREAASDLRTRLTATGVSARLVEPEDPTGLYRVRSGRFDGREEAARHAVRLTDAGFEGIVVPEED